MRITWYGHAAFLIETQGLRIILDPYRSPDSGGYLPIDEPADLVIVSHEEDVYHSHIGQIVPPFELCKALEIPEGGSVVKGIRVETVRVFEHTDRNPNEQVTIIHFRSEDMHLVFLGDLGHPLTEEEVAPLRGADIVLIPAGGPPTIDFPEIPALLDAIGPLLVVPMHYKTRKINLNIKPVIKFLEALPDVPVVRTGTTSLDLSRDTLPERRTIKVLDYALNRRPLPIRASTCCGLAMIYQGLPRYIIARPDRSSELTGQAPFETGDFALFVMACAVRRIAVALGYMNSHIR